MLVPLRSKVRSGEGTLAQHWVLAPSRPTMLRMSLRDRPFRLTSWTWGEVITATWVAIWVVGRSPQPICSASSTMIPSGPRT